jgi:pSer/pThr/pTyr-binding forkhead associated (FHA) protein
MSSETNKSLLKLKIFETAETFFERQYPPEGETIIGRNEQCDLVLASRRTSKRHCRLFFKDGQWHIEDLNSQNGTIVNGVKITLETLKDGDVLQIGDYRIEVEWKPASIGGPDGADDDDRTVVIADSEAEDRTIVRPMASDAVNSSGDSPVDKIISFVKTHKLAAGLAGVLVLFLMMIVVLPSSKEKGTDEGKRTAANESEPAATVQDLEVQGRIDTYLESGRAQLESGNYGQALVRFQAVLEIDPANQSARSYLEETRRKMAEAEEARRRAQEEEKAKTERVKLITARARQAMAGDDLAKAREIIAEALFLAPDNPDIVKLNADIESAIADRQETKQQEEGERQEKMALLKQHFDRGQLLYEQKDYRSALIEWEAVLALNIESPETAHTRAAIVHLRQLMEAEIKDDYEKAEKLYKAGDLGRALVALQKVSEVAPDYRDTRSMMVDALEKVEADARRLYQEGLVYEGLGQQQKAAEKFRAVLKVMPLEDNNYYRRALEKLQ